MLYFALGEPSVFENFHVVCMVKKTVLAQTNTDRHLGKREKSRVTVQRASGVSTCPSCPLTQLSLMEVDVASLRRALVKGKKEREDLARDSVEQRKRYNMKRYERMLPLTKEPCVSLHTHRLMGLRHRTLLLGFDAH